MLVEVKIARNDRSPALNHLTSYLGKEIKDGWWLEPVRGAVPERES